MKVFISYAGEEGLKYAKILDKILKGSGHETFFFKNQVTVRDRLYSEIGKALDKCRIATIIITNSSHASSEQEREYNTACSLNKEQGIVKEGVKLKKFSLLRGRVLKKFNELNAERIMQEFLIDINKLPERKKIFTIGENEDITIGDSK